MQESSAQNSWTGLRGVFGGWLLANPARALIDRVSGQAVPRVLELLSIRGNETVVDAGCGSGFFSIPVAQRLVRGHLTCVDGSPQMLAHLKRRARIRRLDARMEFRQGDVTQLPVGNKVADLAMTTAVLHELSDPASALSELHRVLRPGGRVVVLDAKENAFFGHIVRHRHHADCHGPWTRDSLSAALTSSGFAGVGVEERGVWLLAWGERPVASD
jgi:ubiquinone/menaquinone biosynthesis C-methylase UbiE